MKMGFISNNCFVFGNQAIVLITVLILPIQQHAEVVAEDCNPHRKCLTCPPGLPYHCTSCDQGFFLKRGGAYLSCESCPSACRECDSIYACSSCMNGRYGSLCQDVCAKGCINLTCDQNLGLCGCNKNFSGTYCDRCIDGKYGYESDNCELKCPGNCKACVSDKNCTLCNDGFYGLVCENRCPKGCFLCAQSNGTCFENKCYSNFDGLKCEKCAPGRHGNDCSATCPVNCLSCSSETSCELCTVGSWGAKCQNNCSYGCHEGRCSNDSGICTDHKCKLGFAGRTCTNCIAGLHGAFCNINETRFEKDSSASLHIHELHMSMFVFILVFVSKNITGMT